MAVAVIQTFEATIDEYDAVNEKLDPTNNPPQGLIIHTGGETGGKIKVVDVWESEAAFQSFRESRLGPAVVEVAPDAAPPEVEIYELHDVVKP